MSTSTNNLVGKLKRSILLGAVTASMTVGTVLFINNNGVHASAVTASPLDDRSVAALTSLDQAMESVTARVAPAVVNISVTSKGTNEEGSDEQGENQGFQGQGPGAQGLPPGFAQFFGQGGRNFRTQPQEPQVQHGVGSGVIISPDGYIVTNNHVVEGATQIRVALHDRRILTGKVVGTDKLTDIAVVKVSATDLPAISWGDSSRLTPGQTVLAFGSPFGFFQDSVTRGIVSAVNRANPYSDDARKPGAFIQTDAAINPGNSGGALVNTHGELVGIPNSIITNSGSFAGVGFAIPAQIARATAEQIIQHGHVDHGYLGISMNDVTPDNAHFFNLHEASGAIVAQVTPNSPASRAGLRQGDVIVQLNGQPIVNGSALQVSVSQKNPGTKITLGILREGKPSSLDLTVGEFGKDGEVASASNPAGPNNGRLGVAVSDLTPDVRQQLNAPDQIKGVVVQSVRPDSPAEEAGLQAGDVILEVDRQPATSASQFVAQVRKNLTGQDLLLLVWSKGNASYRTVRPSQNG